MLGNKEQCAVWRYSYIQLVNQKKGRQQGPDRNKTENHERKPRKDHKSNQMWTVNKRWQITRSYHHLGNQPSVMLSFLTGTPYTKTHKCNRRDTRSTPRRCRQYLPQTALALTPTVQDKSINIHLYYSISEQKLGKFARLRRMERR